MPARIKTPLTPSRSRRSRPYRLLHDLKIRPLVCGAALPVGRQVCDDYVHDVFARRRFRARHNRALRRQGMRGKDYFQAQKYFESLSLSGNPEQGMEK